MLGVLLAFRRLALTSELDALRGIGASFRRLLRIAYAYTLVLLLLNLFIVGWIQPWTHYGYERLRFDLRSGALGASVKVGEFNNLGRRMTLRIDRSEKNGSQLHGIFVQVDDKSGTKIAATAEHGRFLSTDDPDVILFRLEHGRMIQDSPKFATPRTLAFNLYDLPINLPRVDSFRQRGHEEIDELTLPELLRDGYFSDQPNEHRLAAQANFHFRIVEVLMMLMLPLLAVALAVPPKRSSSALGIFIGIVMIVAYHKVNQYAEQAASRGSMDPILAMWVPLLALSVLIFWMYHVLAHRPGGQPIGALERAFARVGKAVRKLLPKVQPV
jgi:lipopolysaccharide export system permease protein